MDSTPDAISDAGEDEQVQPLRDRDATATADPADDPAQAEWDQTTAVDEGANEDGPDPATATGRDPAEIPDPADEIPAEDLHGSAAQPESQGEDPLIADLGEEGEGDLSPEDL